MKELRLFVAVRPPEAALATVRSTRDALRERIDDRSVRWVRDENLHITLAFLGATDPARVDEVAAAMRETASSVEAPVDLELAAAGAFPDLRRPRTLWVGVSDDDEKLARLERALRGHLEELGCDLDEKPFRPHVTIGYVRKRVTTADRRSIGDTVAGTEPPVAAFDARELLLVESILGAGGSRYTDLRTVPIG